MQIQMRWEYIVKDSHICYEIILFILKNEPFIKIENNIKINELKIVLMNIFLFNLNPKCKHFLSFKATII